MDDVKLLAGELEPQEMLWFINRYIGDMERAIRDSGARIGFIHHRHLITSAVIEIEFTNKNGETEIYRAPSRDGLLSHGELKDIRYAIEQKAKKYKNKGGLPCK